MSLYRNLHYFPLGLFFLFPLTFLTTYCIAVFWDHVTPILPYISETGALSPESCIFTQMLNIGALLLGICAYIRYRHIVEFSRLHPEQAPPQVLNRMSGLLGFLTCIGMDIAANFQESRVSTFHFIGAFICFSAGTLYFCVQTIITSNMTPHACTECMMYLRVCLSALAFFFSIGTIFPGVMSVKYFRGKDYKKWSADDGGFEWHLVSVISEWLLSFTYCVYILTLLPEFKRIKLYAPVIELHEKTQENKEMIQPELKFV